MGQKLAIIALLVGVSTAAGACSAGSGKKAVSLNTAGGAKSGVSSGTTTSPATGGTGETVSGAGTPAAPGAGSTTAAPRPGTTAAPRTGGTATTTPVVTTGPKATTPVSTGPAPVATGTYSYNLVSGKSTLTTGTTSTTLAVAPTSTLKVSSASNGTQQWVNPTTTTMVAFNSAGVFLLSETIPVANTTCVFNPAVASPPWPLVVGKQFSGRATCGSGSSASTLTLEGGKVIGTASVPLDGAMVSTFMVQSTLKLGTSLVVGETDWYSPALRLPVKTTVSVHGSASGYSIDTTTTYILASSRPS